MVICLCAFCILVFALLIVARTPSSEAALALGFAVGFCEWWRRTRL